jgi:4-alpha-glucanotransferase
VAATTTTHDLPTVTGWWIGADIVWRSKIGQTAARADGRILSKWPRWSAARIVNCCGLPSRKPVSPRPMSRSRRYLAATAPVDEALAFVASTPAPLAIYPLEDLLALAEMPNLPGSIDEHPNWRRRLAVPVSEAL